MKKCCVVASAAVIAAAAGLAHGQAFTQSFADINSLPGWFMQNNSPSPLEPLGWFQGNPAVWTAHSGGTTEYIASNYQRTTSGVPETISCWLLTPQATIDNGAVLDFYARAADMGFPDRLIICRSSAGASTNVGTGPNDVGDRKSVV